VKNGKNIQEAIEKNEKYLKHISYLEGKNKDLLDKLSSKESDMECLEESLQQKLEEKTKLTISRSEELDYKSNEIEDLNHKLRIMEDKENEDQSRIIELNGYRLEDAEEIKRLKECLEAKTLASNKIVPVTVTDTLINLSDENIGKFDIGDISGKYDEARWARMEMEGRRKLEMEHVKEINRQEVNQEVKNIESKPITPIKRGRGRPKKDTAKPYSSKSYINIG